MNQSSAMMNPLIEDSDTSLDEDSSLDEDYSSTSTSLVSGTSGYLADVSFSFFDASYSSPSSLDGNDSFGYLADVSRSSFADISENFNASSASMADDQVFHPSCETVSEAASRTDLSSSTSMGLIATMNNLVIDEGSDLEEGIAKEPAADNERTISENSVARQTAEKTALRDDSEGAGDEVVESFGEERSEAPQSGHEGSTEEDGFDSQPLVTIVCSCSCSAYVNLSGINLGVSSGSGTETELFEDVAVAPCLSRSSYGSMMSLKKSQMKARKGKINLGMAIKY